MKIINKLLINERANGTYTNSTFFEAYMKGEAIAGIINGEFSAIDVIDLYGLWFDIDLSYISNLNDDLLTKIIKETIIGDMTAKEMIFKAISFAEAVTSDNVNTFEQCILEYIDTSKLRL